MKLVLVCGLLLVVATSTASSVEANACFKFVDFCDGIQVSFFGPGGALWYHFDCANDSPMDVKKRSYAQPPFTDQCPVDPGDESTRMAIRSEAENGPGAFYFLIDLPLDGDLDMHMGSYPGGTCWINQLKYTFTHTPCDMVPNQASRSSVQ